MKTDKKEAPDTRPRMTPGELAFWERIVAACVGGAAGNIDFEWKLEHIVIYAHDAVAERRKIVPIDPRMDAHAEADMLIQAGARMCCCAKNASWAYTGGCF